MMFIGATAALYSKMYSFGMTLVIWSFQIYVKTNRSVYCLISIPDEELFSEAAVGCTASYLSKLYDVPVGFVTPTSYFETVYCFICGRQRVAVARYRMICLVIVHQSLYNDSNAQQST